MATFNRESIQVPSVENDVNLDVWLYKPAGPGPYPVVVAGHGLAMIKDAGLAAFGERWAQEAGYASLILDYRGFGSSGGEPRNLAIVENQLQDFRTVIEYARAHPETFKVDKIVVMGSASAGLYVADLVVHDGQLAGGMAHVPMLDGHASLNSGPTNLRLVFWAIVDSLKAKLGLSPVFVNCAGKPGDLAIVTFPSAWPGFEAMFAQGATPFSKAPNLIAPRIAFDLMATRPGLELKNATCPMLVVMAEDDETQPRSITQSIVDGAEGKVEVVMAPGGHFDMMKGGKGYEQNVAAQIAFLRRLL